jgi:hypothetical protein
MCDRNSDPVTAIFDTENGEWEEFNRFTQALQNQLPNGITLNLARDEGMDVRTAGEYFQPAFSPLLARKAISGSSVRKAMCFSITARRGKDGSQRRLPRGLGVDRPALL